MGVPFRSKFWPFRPVFHIVNPIIVFYMLFSAQQRKILRLWCLICAGVVCRVVVVLFPLLLPHFPAKNNVSPVFSGDLCERIIVRRRWARKFDSKRPTAAAVAFSRLGASFCFFFHHSFLRRFPAVWRDLLVLCFGISVSCAFYCAENVLLSGF